MRRLVVLFFFAVLGALAQTCDTTKTCVSLPFNVGATTTGYVCDAPPIVAETTISVAATTLTNIVVLSNVGTVTVPAGHNLYPGAVLNGTLTSAAQWFPGP